MNYSWRSGHSYQEKVLFPVMFYTFSNTQQECAFCGIFRPYSRHILDSLGALNKNRYVSCAILHLVYSLNPLNQKRYICFLCCFRTFLVLTLTCFQIARKTHLALHSFFQIYTPKCSHLQSISHRKQHVFFHFLGTICLIFLNFGFNWKQNANNFFNIARTGKKLEPTGFLSISNWPCPNEVCLTVRSSQGMGSAQCRRGLEFGFGMRSSSWMASPLFCGFWACRVLVIEVEFKCRFSVQLSYMTSQIKETNCNFFCSAPTIQTCACFKRKPKSKGPQQFYPLVFVISSVLCRLLGLPKHDSTQMCGCAEGCAPQVETAAWRQNRLLYESLFR